MEFSEKEPTIDDFEPIQEDYDTLRFERIYREQGLESSIDDALDARRQYVQDFRYFKKYYSDKLETETDKKIFLDHARYLTVYGFHLFTRLMDLQATFNRTKSEQDKKILDDKQSNFTYWRLEGVYKATDKALKLGQTCWQVELLGRLGLPHEIDYDLAINGFRGTARDPNGRAIYEQQSYAQSTYGFYERLEPFVKNEDQKNILLGLIDDFKQSFISRRHEIFNARSGEVSSFITGSSKFPTKRNQKRVSRTDKLESVFIDWYEETLLVAKETLLLAASDDEKFKMLWSKLRDDLIDNISSIMAIDNGDMAGFDRSSFVNSAARKIRSTHDNKLVQKSLDFVKDMQKDMKKPVFTTRHSIWKILDDVPKEKKVEVVEEADSILLEFEGGEIRDTASCDRVQIYFEDKPSEAVRGALKSSAWRWSPTNGVWQRKRTDNARVAAQNIVKCFLDDKAQRETEEKTRFETKKSEALTRRNENEKPLVCAGSEVSKNKKVEKINYSLPFSMPEKYEILRQASVYFIVFRMENKMIAMSDEEIEIVWSASAANLNAASMNIMTCDEIRGDKPVYYKLEPHSLKIWASFDKIDIAKLDPIVRGKKTVKWLREVFKIPNPDQAQGDLFL